MTGIVKVFTPEAIRLVKAMKANGASFAVMAAAIGCSVGSLRARASQLGFFRDQQAADEAA